MNMIRKELEDYKILLRSVPSPIISLFIVSVIVMNLLANKELFSIEFLALDCGFTVSWVSFLCMDIICKRFGAKASVKISVMAMFVNLCVCLLFKLMSLTPGMWGEYYSTGMTEVNTALNQTFGGSWYVVFGSSLAMIVSAICNSILNQTIGRNLAKDNYQSFAIRSFISTGIAQFVDNFIFALVVSHVFFGWTWLQVIVCSITGAVAELVGEVLLSPVGYKVVKEWQREDVGVQYFEYVNSTEN